MGGSRTPQRRTKSSPLLLLRPRTHPFNSLVPCETMSSCWCCWLACPALQGWRGRLMQCMMAYMRMHSDLCDVEPRAAYQHVSTLSVSPLLTGHFRKHCKNMRGPQWPGSVRCCCQTKIDSGSCVLYRFPIDSVSADARGRWLIEVSLEGHFLPSTRCTAGVGEDEQLSNQSQRVITCRRSDSSWFCCVAWSLQRRCYLR